MPIAINRPDGVILGSHSLPVVSGHEAIRALERLGFQVLPNRGKGDHVVLWNASLRRPLVVPDHKELDRGTLYAQSFARPA